MAMTKTSNRRWSFFILALTISSAPAAAEIVGDFPEVVLFATNSMEIQSSAQVFSGDVVVNAPSLGPTLDSPWELSFGNKAKTPVDWEVKADSIAVGQNVTLAGTESCNLDSEIAPCDSLFGLGPVYAALPVFQIPIFAGTAQDLNVPNSMTVVLNSTVDDSYGDVSAGLESTIIFEAGVYNLNSLTVGKKGDLLFRGPTEIRVAGTVDLGIEVDVKADTGYTVAASDVIFYVDGDNATPSQSAPAARVGPKSIIDANFYVRDGTLVLGSNVIATGAFLAKDLLAETKVQVNRESFFDFPPVADDDAYSTHEDTQLMVAAPGVLLNDTDQDLDPLTAILVSPPSHGTLTLNPDGSFTYSPDLHYYSPDGSPDSFTYKACDESPANVDNCDEATVEITVVPVNDVPSFDAGPDQEVNEDAGAQSVAWATDISAGAGDETDQSVSFNVSNDNNSLFSTQPVVASDGTLSYTPAADEFGSAVVTVSLSDNCDDATPPFSCGTNGELTSADQTFTITVNSVNDEPSFTKGPDQTVDEDAGPQSVSGWATNISPGPANESGQTVTFLLSSDNSGLFSVQPAIASDGTLTYTPAVDAFGMATVSVEAQDDGGTANGGDDTSDAQTFTINVSSVNDPPVAVDDSITTPEETPVTIDVLTNDTAGPLNENQARTLDGVSQAASGTVAINAGDPSKIDYTPNANFFGEDTFPYTVCDGGDDDNTATDSDDLCATGSVTVTVTNVNDPPTADQQELFATATVTITLTGSDPDGDSLTFAVVSGPTKGALGSITPIVPTPQPGQTAGPVVSAKVDYTPDSQQCSGDPLECPEDSFVFRVSDPSAAFDDATVTINPGGDPGCTVDADCGAPHSGFFCKLPEGVCEPNPLGVIDAKDALIAEETAIETETDAPVGIVLVAAAPLPPAAGAIGNLAFSIVSGPSGGTLSPVTPITPAVGPIRSASVTFTPTCDPMGGTCVGTFDFKACEAANLSNCDTATVEIVVADNTPQKAPVAEDVSATTTAGGEVTFSLVASAGSPNVCVDDSDCGVGFVCNTQESVCEPENPGRSFAAAFVGATSGPDPLDNGGMGQARAARRGPVTRAALGYGAWTIFNWWDETGAGGPPQATCTGPGDLVDPALNLEGAFTFVVDPDDEACLSVTDVRLTGDQFRILNFGQEIDTTPLVPRGGLPNVGDDQDAAFAGSQYSSRRIPLPSGSYSIEIEAIPGPTASTGSLWCGRGYLRVDTVGTGNCDAEQPLLIYTVLTVPDGSFGTLTDSVGQTVTAGTVLLDASLTLNAAAGATGVNSQTTYTATNTNTGLTSNVAIVDLQIADNVVFGDCVSNESFCDDGRPNPLASPGGQGEAISGPTRGLTVVVDGSGGSVSTSSVELRDGRTLRPLYCSSAECSKLFPRGEEVTLFARPDGEHFEFERWGGDCWGDEPILTVRLGEATRCVATFRKKVEDD